MKRVALTAATVLLGFSGLLGVVVFAWTTWVISTGDGWLLALTFNSSTGVVPALELWFGGALIAGASLFVARVSFRKSKSVVQPT